MKQVRVNVRTAVDNAAIKHETLNGRAIIRVPSATLPDNVVMNGIKYLPEEIEKSFRGLERTPAPVGHPMVNGKFVSASDPEGLNVGYVGAWNANVRRENGRVFLDKIIDVERAGESEKGKALLNAIKNKKPIHTSNALLCNLEVSNAEDCEYLARNMVWDHDAILLDEPGAATPEQGVGMFVNASGEAKEIEVVNSVFSEADRDLDWGIQSVASAMEKRAKAAFLDNLKALLIDMWPRQSQSERDQSLNQKEDDMTVSKEQFDDLSATVNALKESTDKMTETVAAAVANAVKPLLEANAAMVANAKAAEDAEKATLVADVVKANLLTEAVAKELTLNALKELAQKAKPGKAAPIIGGDPVLNAGKSQFKAPEGE